MIHANLPDFIHRASVRLEDFDSGKLPMSNAITLAAVTAVLKDLLENRFANDAIATSVGEVLVTALPPDRVSVGADERPQLNLFLYQVSQNRNADWVVRDRATELSSAPDRTTTPPLALDLHYLLTAYGAKDFQAELLLGHALQLLHENSELTSDTVFKSLMRAVEGGGYGVFSQALAMDSVETLSQTLGPIRFSPEFFNMEETSKLWSSLQTHYRPSAAYKASMVLIESDPEEDARSQPFLPALAQPIIEQVYPLGAQDQSVTAGCTLVVVGQNFDPDLTQLRFLGRSQLVQPMKVQSDEIRVVVPASLNAGIQGVQVVQAMGKQAQDGGLESNLFAFTLHPQIDVTVEAVQKQKKGGCSAQLLAKVKPTVTPSQQVHLILNERSEKKSGPLVIVAEPRTDDSQELRFQIAKMKPGTYWVQVQIDGAQSVIDASSKRRAKATQVEICP